MFQGREWLNLLWMFCLVLVLGCSKNDYQFSATSSDKSQKTEAVDPDEDGEELASIYSGGEVGDVGGDIFVESSSGLVVADLESNSNSDPKLDTGLLAVLYGYLFN